MKQILFSLSLLFLSFFSQAFESAIENEFELTLAQHKGKVIYVDFWASWCGPCRKSFPWMNAMQSKYQDQAFTVLSVNLDNSKDLAAKFLQTSPADFPILYDAKGKLAKKFNIKGMPSSYLINKAGKIVSAHVGFTQSKKMKYEAEIKHLIAE
jgi:thiol-disulfide isomerase/thioredoxin